MFNQTKVGGFNTHQANKIAINQQQMRQTMFKSNFMSKMRTNGQQAHHGSKF